MAPGGSSRIVEEIFDAAVAQPCRKIADARRDLTCIGRERRLTLVELLAGASKRVGEFVDLVGGDTLAVFKLLTPVLPQSVGEAPGR